MDKDLKHYDAPEMEVIEMSAEQSFASSPAYDGFDNEESWN
jgi:hypothetical protein